jgi:uncharacterized iron-regulated membrane protein
MEGMANLDSTEHAQHSAWGRHHSALSGPNAFLALDKMVATVAPLGLPNPVLISPPATAGGNWTAKSDTRDRPLRVDLVLDGKTGAILSRTDFHSKPVRALQRMKAGCSALPTRWSACSLSSDW